MFARHTPTRMRGSAVVQGFKSLASKLHPQLPLSPKESQRLLTALTSSFRRHLDEVHPPAAAKSGKRLAKRGASKTSSQALHSSASLADEHLASVLTSPLLVKGVKVKEPEVNAGIVKVELATNPGKDPIVLLEDLQERGLATIAIANVCLEAYYEQLNTLSTEARQKRVAKHQAGKRSLAWLWNSRLYNAPEFVDDIAFMNLMTPLIMMEGHEEYLWDWILIDMSLAESQYKGRGDAADSRRHRYRWKGHLLRSMVLFALQDGSENGTGADQALKIYFRSVDPLTSAASDHHLRHLPLIAARVPLENALCRDLRLRRSTNAQLFNRLVDECYLTRKNHLFLAFDHAWLSLFHPTTPNTMPALNLLKKVFSDPTSSNEHYVLFSALVKKRKRTRRNHIFTLMVRAAALLSEARNYDDALWIVRRIEETFPELARYRYIEHHMQEIVDQGESRPGSVPKVEDGERPRVPYATFV